MKRKFYLGWKLSGNLLNKFSNLIIFLIFGCILIFAGCSKKTTGPVDPPPAFPAISISPDNNPEILNGNTFTFAWSMTGDLKNPSVSLDGNTLSTLAVGESSQKFTGTGTHVFIASCESLNGTPISKSITVTVKDALPVLPTVTLNANKTTILEGDSVLLSWHNYNSDSSTLTSVPAIFPLTNFAVDSVGSLWVKITQTTVFTLTGKNKFGATTSSATITAIAPPPPPTTADSLFGSWLKMDLLYQAIGSTEFISVIENCEKDDTLKFLTNFRFEMHQGPVWCGGSSEIWFNGDWFLFSNNTQLNLMGTVYTILELTNTTLVLVRTNGSGTFKTVYQKS